MILMVFHKIVHDGICTAGNCIEAEGAKAIAEALKVPNGSLVTLNLANNAICGVATYYGDGTYDPSGIRALAEALKVPNGSLSTLDLSGKHQIWKLSCIGFSSSEPTFNMGAIYCIPAKTSQL